mmetsp:Transcript_27934/g.67315  ORF Transcript_27934/g.67315 Transcript_27934/m.67315 type:complete len:756 (+) Transcript_27934:376-2643(+)
MVILSLPLALVLLQHHVGVGQAFQPHPPMRFPGERLESYTHTKRGRRWQTDPKTLFADSSHNNRRDPSLSATESDLSTALDDMLEKFAMPLEFTKSGAFASEGADDASTKAEGIKAEGPLSTTTVAPSSDKVTDAAAGFAPSADTPLANKYYLKKEQILAEEAKKIDMPTSEEKTSSETSGASKSTAPEGSAPRRRFFDFGIASEQAEPANGESTALDLGGKESTTDTTTAKPRGFTDFSTGQQSQPFQVSIEKNKNVEGSGVPETKPLSGSTKPPAATTSDSVSNVQETSSKEEKATPADAVTSAEKEGTAPPAASPSATKKEGTTDTTPAAAISQPSPTELIQTQPVTSPLDSVTFPSVNLDVEDFGLLPLIIIGVSVYLALGVYLKQVNDKDEGYAGWDELRKREDEQKEPTKNLLQTIKDAGKAGAISYALWEAAFWGVSVPVCLVSYRQVTGHWPDLTSSEDLKKLGLEAFAFVNFARLAVPIRIGLALSTIPWVEENILGKFREEEDAEEEEEEELMASTATLGYLQPPSAKGFPGDSIEQQIEDEDATSNIAEVEERLTKMETEASRIASKALDSINAGIDPSLLEYCEPGEVNEDCSESIQGYLGSLASTGAVATDGEVKAIVGYLDSLSSNITPNQETGVAFTNYLDALSEGYIPAPSSAEAVASYLDVLSSSSDDETTREGESISNDMKTDTRINEVEERLVRLEASVTSLPDDIASRLVDWQISQDKKLSDEMEKITKLLVDGK